MLKEALKELLGDTAHPNEMPDAPLLRDYLRAGCRHGDPIVLSFGETWTEAPPRLRGLLADLPAHADGYQFSMYGLPSLLSTLKKRMAVEHRIEPRAFATGVIDLAVSWSGTRTAMFDFGRIVAERSESARERVIVVMGPSWDYEGVFKPLGFTMRYVHLRKEDAFAPSLERFEATLAAIRANAQQQLAMVVFNAQHNPTGVNFPAAFLEPAVRRAFDEGAHVLLDDAYFGVTDEGIEPTSALKIVLDEVRGRPEADALKWLGVRSLGKQFHCNGWALGVVVAAPQTLDALVNKKSLQHRLMFGGVAQHAMARWLQSTESDAFLESQRASLRRKRAFVKEFLATDWKAPGSVVHTGACTAYTMIPIPRAYEHDPSTAQAFLDHVFARTGVLLAPAWPWPVDPETHVHVPYARVYMGPSFETVRTGFARLRDAGFRYDMPNEMPP